MFAAAVQGLRANPAFARDVAAGLTSVPQKTLPASWLYDEVGSALFEVITVLPEYGLTRADGALLAGAAEEIVAAAGHPATIVELGSGSSGKTRLLIAEALRRQPALTYHPIDISETALGREPPCSSSRSAASSAASSSSAPR